MKYFFFVLIAVLAALPFLALGQTPVPTPVLPLPELPVVSDSDFLLLLVQSLGGLKGASALAIAGVVVQLLLKFLATPLAGNVFKRLSGAMKLTIVLGLSLASGVLALMLPPTSLNLGAALVHSTTLTAFLVFFNQIYKQFVEKKASEVPKV